MMPFLIPSLDELMRQLMGIFVRKEAIPKHSYQLPKVDVAKRETQLPAELVQILQKMIGMIESCISASTKIDVSVKIRSSCRALIRKWSIE